METSIKIVGAHVVFHRLLKASCCNSVLAVLLCKRTHDAPIHPGHWALFGGKRHDDEKPEDAVRREVKEELGLDLAANDLIALRDVRIARGDGTLGISYFRSSLDLGIHKLTLQPNPHDGKVEGEALGWFDAEEIHHLTVRPEDRIALIDFFGKYGV